MVVLEVAIYFAFKDLNKNDKLTAYVYIPYTVKHHYKDVRL